MCSGEVPGFGGIFHSLLESLDPPSSGDIWGPLGTTRRVSKIQFLNAAPITGTAGTYSTTRTTPSSARCARRSMRQRITRGLLACGLSRRTYRRDIFDANNTSQTLRIARRTLLANCRPRVADPSYAWTTPGRPRVRWDQLAESASRTL